MDEKTNFFRLVRREGPQFVPWRIPAAGLHYYGCNPQDSRPEGATIGSRWRDIWNVTWDWELEGVMPFPKDPPLAEPGSLSGYAWPDPHSEAVSGCLRAQFDAIEDRESKVLTISHRSTLFERAWKLMGMDTLMVSMMIDRPRAEAVLDGLTEFALGIAEEYLAFDPDFVGLGDDLGAQRGPLVNPDLVRELLVPRYRRIVEHYRARKPDIVISLHSCGQVTDFLDDFIDLGIDILNPVQARANDLDELRRRTRGRMTLEGGVDTAVVAHGTPVEVRDLVRTRLEQLGRQGEYICHPDQAMPFPEENRRALREAVEEFGVLR